MSTTILASLPLFGQFLKNRTSLFKGATFTIATPFQWSRTTINNKDTAILAISHAILGTSFRKNRLFWSHTMKVHGGMNKHKGLVGHAIRRQVFGNQAWTVSVWRDHASLNAFIHSSDHRQAVEVGSPALISAGFARVEVDVADLPLSWAKIEDILKATYHNYHHHNPHHNH